jgi:hypothetical protein
MIDYICSINSYDNGLLREEIAPPVTQTLGVKPEGDRVRVAIHRRTEPSYYNNMEVQGAPFVEQVVFELVRFCTQSWIEDYVENGVSKGRYHIIYTYSLVPEGTRIEDSAMPNHRYDRYGYSNTNPFGKIDEGELRYRLGVIESTLQEMNKKPILDRQEFEQIKTRFRGLEQTEIDIPKRLREFDFFENDINFNVE